MNQYLLLWEQSSKSVNAEKIANPKAQEGVGQAKLGRHLHGHLDLYKTGLDIYKKKKPHPTPDHNLVLISGLKRLIGVTLGN